MKNFTQLSLATNVRQTSRRTPRAGWKRSKDEIVLPRRIAAAFDLFADWLDNLGRRGLCEQGEQIRICHGWMIADLNQPSIIDWSWFFNMANSTPNTVEGIFYDLWGELGSWVKKGQSEHASPCRLFPGRLPFTMPGPNLRMKIAVNCFRAALKVHLPEHFRVYGSLLNCLQNFESPY